MNCVMANAELSRSSQPLPAIFVAASLRVHGSRKDMVIKVTIRLSCSHWILASNLKLLEMEKMYGFLKGDLGLKIAV